MNQKKEDLHMNQKKEDLHKEASTDNSSLKKEEKEKQQWIAQGASQDSEPIVFDIDEVTIE